MRVTDEQYADILKRPGVRGQDTGAGAGGDTVDAQRARRANAKAGDDRATNSTANLEQDIGNEPLGAQKAAGHDTPCRVHIHSLRHKLADSDGISGKAAIDGLVYAGLLLDDSPAEISQVTFSQEQINRKEQEKTIITLTWGV